MAENGKMAIFDPFLGQFSHFSAILPPFSRWGQNPFLGHVFPISGRRPDLGSVQGNRDRKNCLRKSTRKWTSHVKIHSEILREPGLYILRTPRNPDK